jgi:putative nucleotidyltransferase with HDIG domain
VTPKNPLKTGAEALEQICLRMQQFGRSLDTGEPSQRTAEGALVLPTAAREALHSLALIVDAKDPYTERHAPHVASYAAVLAEALGMTKAQVEEVRFAAVLHDIGKIGVPEAIFTKNGPLNSEEWERMQQHAHYGAQLLEAFPSLAAIRPMIKHHHEFFDGSGYPQGLSGEAIPMGARIIALADAYDTITSERSYKRARTAEEAFAEIRRCAGTRFDPQLVEPFIEALLRLSRGAENTGAQTEPVEGEGDYANVPEAAPEIIS